MTDNPLRALARPWEDKQMHQSSSLQGAPYSYLHHWYLVQCLTPHGQRVNVCRFAKLSSDVPLCSGYPDGTWQTRCSCACDQCMKGLLNSVGPKDHIWVWGSRLGAPGSPLSACKKSTLWQQLQPAGTRSRQESLFGPNRKLPEGKCGLASVNPWRMAPEKPGDVLAGTDHIAAVPSPPQARQRTSLDLWDLMQGEGLGARGLGSSPVWPWAGYFPSLDRSPYLSTDGFELCISPNGSMSGCLIGGPSGSLFPDVF